MRPPLRRSAVLSLPIALSALASLGGGAAEPSPKVEAIAGAYEKLAGALASEDLPGFMKFFDTSFVFEAEDGSSVDRGPWRRLWEERFEEREYEKASFEIEGALEETDGGARLRVRRILVFREGGSTARRLEEARFEDSWIAAEGGFRLAASRALEVAPEATVFLEEAPAPEIAARLSGERKGRPPLVEPVARDEARRRVTFLFRGRGGEEAVALRGGLPAPEPKPLARLGETGLWCRTEILPADARFTYEFEVRRRVSLRGAGGAVEVLRTFSLERDPSNPSSIDGRSFLELPLAPPRLWEGENPARAEGSLELETLESRALGERRSLSVYAPAGLGEGGKNCALAVLIDEGTYESRRWTRAVLDRAIAAREIPPLVAVLVHREGSRRGGLEPSPEAVAFVVDEVLPAVRGSRGGALREGPCVAGGRGLGAAIAAACALERPEAFSGLILQSLRDPRPESPLRRAFARTAKRDAKVHLEFGTLDPHLDRLENAALRDVLEAKGCALTWREFAGDGNLATWQETLARGLAAVLAK